MDRRDFIKLTAITGTSATLASCGNPEHQLIRFVPDEDIVPGVAEWKPSVCPMCAAGCGVTVRVMEADVETTRNGQAGVVEMAVAKKLEGNAEGSDQPGRAVRARPGGDSDHLSPRSPDAPDEANAARAAAGEFKEITLGRGDRGAGRRSSTRSPPPEIRSRWRSSTRPHRGRRTALAAEFLEGFGAPAPIAFELFGDDVLRRANVISFGREQLPTIDLARSRFVISFGADFLGTGTRRWRRAPPTARCGRGARACAARSCRSSRGCR